ncbi:MAG: hypothetical protein QOJ65_2599 [Fimbriimonadaceae bacterium]|jgi:hypothetical protein|nr:hypothetical protein [Fimbriimonadaceae bacterium]
MTVVTLGTAFITIATMYAAWVAVRRFRLAQDLLELHDWLHDRAYALSGLDDPAFTQATAKLEELSRMTGSISVNTVCVANALTPDPKRSIQDWHVRTSKSVALHNAIVTVMHAAVGRIARYVFFETLSGYYFYRRTLKGGKLCDDQRRLLRLHTEHLELAETLAKHLVTAWMHTPEQARIPVAVFIATRGSDDLEAVGYDAGHLTFV